MGRKAASRILSIALLMAMLILAFSIQVKRVHAPSSAPYTDFHDLLFAGSSDLQAYVGFAYEPFSQPGHWLSLGELSPFYVDPFWDNNNFVPANGRLLFSLFDDAPLREQILNVEFDTDSLSKIYVPATDGTTYWLYLWVADDGSTYYDREMTQLARPAPGIAATVDIKPDTLNLASRGKWIRAYIELPQGYNIGNIDLASIRLNDTIPAEVKMTKVGDYDGDSVPDLLVMFDRAQVTSLLSVGEATLTMTGEINGTPFEGTDTISAFWQGHRSPSKR